MGMKRKSNKHKGKTYTIFEAEKILGIDWYTLHGACKHGFIKATKIDNSGTFGSWHISKAELKRAKKTLPVVLDMKKALAEILLEQQKRKR